MDTRRLLLGDWPGPVRDGLDVLRLVLAAGAVAYAVRGDAGAALLLAGFAALALGARLLQLPRLLDLAFLLGLLLQGFGEAVGAYDGYPAFDEIVHVTFPMLTAPVLYVALARLDVLPDPRDDTGTRHLVGIGVVTTALGLAVGAVWEVLEYASDLWLGSDLSEDNDDTVGDLLADGIGALVGAGLLVLWTARSWGSVRRLPGTNTREAVDD